MINLFLVFRTKLQNENTERNHRTKNENKKFFEDLEHSERFSDVSNNLLRLDFQNIESHGLTQGSALSDRENISLLNISEARRQVSGDVLVTLLKSTVFLYVVEVISSYDDSLCHLRGDAHSFQNSSSDAHVSCERAFLIDVVSVLCRGRRLESQSDVTVESGFFTFSLCKHSLLRSDEDRGLFHERSLILIEDFVVGVRGSHFCCCVFVLGLVVVVVVVVICFVHRIE